MREDDIVDTAENDRPDFLTIPLDALERHRQYTDLNTLWEGVLSDHRYIVGQVIEGAATIQWLIDNDPRLDEDSQSRLAKASSLIRSLPEDLVSSLVRMEYELNGVKNYRISGGKK